MAVEDRSAVELYTAGRTAMEDGDAETALELITAAVTANPTNPGWRATLGRLLLDAGQSQEAIEELEQATGHAPHLSRMHILLGRAYDQAHLTSKAKSSFLQAIQVDNESPAAWTALGRFALAQGDLDTAKHAFSTVVALEPRQVIGYVMLADIAAREKNTEAEIRYRGIVADLRPDHVPSQIIHAASLMKAERFPEARKRYQLVATLQPDHAAASAIAEELGRWQTFGAPEGGLVSVDYYDEVYAKDNHYRENGASLQKAGHFELICDLLEAHNATAVLDLGCGPGQFAQFLRSRSQIPYLGVDYSRVAIRSAMNRAVPNAEFQVLDLTNSEIPPCPIKTSVICTEVLEHILDDEALLAKVPAGHPVYCSVPSFYTFGHVRYFKDGKEVEKRYGKYLDAFSVKEICLSAGTNRLFVFHGLRNTTNNNMEEQ